MRNRLAILTVAALLGGFSSFAAPLDPSAALSRAMEGNAQRKAAYGGAGVQLVYTAQAETAARENCFYVFNRSNGGYIIVTADDRLPAVLGYSDSGTYDATNVPPQMKWWLDGKASEIAGFYQHAGPKTAVMEIAGERKASSSYKNISPLIQSRWDQGDPYWNMCPTKNGKRCYTGCVATAMAMVMKYHAWPEVGTGDHKYYWKGGGKNVTCDFSSITFKWDVMTDTYDRSSSDESKDAVAELMFACGVSVNMDYGTDSDGGSGAMTQKIPAALKQYFGYASTARYDVRAFHSDADWVDILYKELEAGRPILYGGDGSMGGHQFICDGYRASDGFFHFNWGWSGDSDGYFSLDNLDPDSLGAGGGSGGFNNGQDVIIGIQKPGGSDVTVPQIAGIGDFSIIETDGDDYMFGYVTNDSNPRYAGFYNYGDEDVTGYPGVRIENTAGGDAVYAYYAEEVTLDKPLDTGSVSLYNNIPIDMSTVTLAPGQTYRAYPIFRQNNKDYDVSVDPDSRAYAEFTTAGEPSKNYNISVTDFEYDPVKAGEDFAMKFTVTNSGTDPFSGEIHLQLTELIDATLEAVPAYDVKIDMENNTVEPGESVTLSGTVKTLFEENSLYTAEFECDEERVSDTYLVLVGNKITNIELPEAVSLTVGDDPDFLEVVYTPEDATWKRVEWTSSDITVAAVSENGGIEAINKGTAEITATTTDGSELSATCLVTVEDGSIVGIVMLEGVCDVYTVDGVAVATGMEMKEIVNLPAGIYMIRTADKTFKYYKKR